MCAVALPAYFRQMTGHLVSSSMKRASPSFELYRAMMTITIHVATQ